MVIHLGYAYRLDRGRDARERRSSRLTGLTAAGFRVIHAPSRTDRRNEFDHANERTSMQNDRQGPMMRPVSSDRVGSSYSAPGEIVPV